MTASRELHERIDRLSPEAQAELAAFLDEKERIQKHLEALTAFQEDWTPDEEAAWLEGTQRRPWRTAPLEEQP